MKTLIIALMFVISGSAFAGPIAKCLFTNTAGYYTGICEVNEEYDAAKKTPAQVCEDVLAYLKNPSHGGKDYCLNTSVFLGWEQVETGL